MWIEGGTHMRCRRSVMYVARARVLCAPSYSALWDELNVRKGEEQRRGFRGWQHWRADALEDWGDRCWG
jgi:hypothetical protein